MNWISNILIGFAMIMAIIAGCGILSFWLLRLFGLMKRGSK